MEATSAVLITVLGLTSLGCDTNYSLPPTFCDDWCRATLRAGCDDEPEGCVRQCEQTRATQGCFELQLALLECYEIADDEIFTCVEAGFGSETRVRNGACQRERDALFECEAPGIAACLVACRNLQAAQLDAQEDLADAVPETTTDAGCPNIDVSCESVCWTLQGAQALDGFDGSLVDASASASTLAPTGADAMSCVIDGVAPCFGAASSLAAPSTVSIEDLVRSCLEASSSQVGGP